MVTAKTEHLIRLRARQIQRLYNYRLTIKQRNAHKILPSDIKLANLLEPDFAARDGEADWEDRWVSNPNSLPQILGHFRRGADALVGINKGEVRVVEDEGLEVELEVDDANDDGFVEVSLEQTKENQLSETILTTVQIPTPAAQSIEAPAQVQVPTLRPAPVMQAPVARRVTLEARLPERQQAVITAYPIPEPQGPISQATQNLQQFTGGLAESLRHDRRQRPTLEGNPSLEERMAVMSLATRAVPELGSDTHFNHHPVSEHFQPPAGYNTTTNLTTPTQTQQWAEYLATHHPEETKLSATPEPEPEPESYGLPQTLGPSPQDQDQDQDQDQGQGESSGRTDIHPILTAENLRRLAEMRRRRERRE